MASSKDVSDPGGPLDPELERRILEAVDFEVPPREDAEGRPRPFTPKELARREELTVMFRRNAQADLEDVKRLSEAIASDNAKSVERLKAMLDSIDQGVEQEKERQALNLAKLRLEVEAQVRAGVAQQQALDIRQLEIDERRAALDAPDRRRKTMPDELCLEICGWLLAKSMPGKNEEEDPPQTTSARAIHRVTHARSIKLKDPQLFVNEQDARRIQRYIDTNMAEVRRAVARDEIPPFFRRTSRGVQLPPEAETV